MTDFVEFMESLIGFIIIIAAIVITTCYGVALVYSTVHFGFWLVKVWPL